MRYAENAARVLSLPTEAVALLATLMLRGPQTPGEIRQRTERMHAFADMDAVDAVLEHLQEKYPPMVTPLPRAPGTKETRFGHLMGGRELLAAQVELLGSQPLMAGHGRGRSAELEDEVRRLRDELEQLRADFNRFRNQFE